MHHVVRVALKEKVVEALLELIVRRRNDVVEIEDYFRVIAIPAKGKNFHGVLIVLQSRRKRIELRVTIQT